MRLHPVVYECRNPRPTAHMRCSASRGVGRDNAVGLGWRPRRPCCADNFAQHGPVLLYGYCRPVTVGAYARVASGRTRYARANQSRKSLAQIAQVGSVAQTWSAPPRGGRAERNTTARVCAHLVYLAALHGRGMSPRGEALPHDLGLLTQARDEAHYLPRTGRSASANELHARTTMSDPVGWTSACQPGGSQVVALYSVTMAGPAMRLPARRSPRA